MNLTIALGRNPVVVSGVLEGANVLDTLKMFLEHNYSLSTGTNWKAVYNIRGTPFWYILTNAMPIITYKSIDYANADISFEVDGIQVQFLTGRKSPVPVNWRGTFTSYRGLAHFKSEIQLFAQKLLYDQKVARGERVGDVSDIKMYDFELFGGERKAAEPLTEENVLKHLLQRPIVYIDYTVHSYSHMTEPIFRKFRYPFTYTTPNAVYTELLAKNKHEAEVRADIFLQQMELPANASSKVAWDGAVERARVILEDYAITIPELACYNEATRRLLISPIAQQTSKYLAGSMLVEPHLCWDQANPPSHFVGTGPLDFVFGIAGSARTRTSTASVLEHTASTAVNAATSAVSVHLFPLSSQAQDVAAELLRKMEEAAVWEEEEEEEEEDGLLEANNSADLAVLEVLDDDVASAVLVPSQVVTTGIYEEVTAGILSKALRQLMAQQYDRFFVADEELLRIANIGAEEEDNVRAGKKRKREASVQEMPKRAHKSVIGILTTGHTWQVFRFSVESEDLSDMTEKPLVQCIGVFCVPVLQGRRTDGASQMTALDVARVMAVLVLAAQHEL